ncbi:hypothetical protein [Dendronalium phyllosphericum]|nr:hypothetical protein [Dendronalium phyllosphericum]
MANSSFSCNGEYGCDLSLTIEAGAKAALEDYETANDGEGWG